MEHREHGVAALRIMVLGLRGLPDVEGGIERHAEHLYPRLVELGCAVTVLVRSPYHAPDKPREYRGVSLEPLWSPHGGSLETFVHTFFGTLYAAVARPDLLHIHAIGPALFTPLARLLGLRVVVTHHGPDYEREKWSPFAKRVLRWGERAGMRCSNARIAISKTIQQLIRERHQLDSTLIPNGVELPELPTRCDTRSAFGLEPGKYVLQVSRFVREKRQLDLVHAFTEARLPGWKLALVGGIDESDAYMREVFDAVGGNPAIVLTGFQKGRALQELFGHAGMFVLPSSHEGLPIALLEALSYGLAVIASDIAANVEIGLPSEQYVPVGDVAALAARLRDSVSRPSDEATAARVQHLRSWVARRYDWETIGDETLDVYRRAIADRVRKQKP
jgi:glycosyltransferase involved in cell wall biosynthesis